jgi:hypothetical protein
MPARISAAGILLALALSPAIGPPATCVALTPPFGGALGGSPRTAPYARDGDVVIESSTPVEQSGGRLRLPLCRAQWMPNRVVGDAC